MPPRSSSRETFARRPRPALAPRHTLSIAASVTVGLGAFLFAAVFSGLLFGVPEALAHHPTYRGRRGLLQLAG